MQPLALHVKPVGTREGIRANVHAALARSLPELSPALVSHDGTMVCVGSGPSMPSMVEDIRREREAGRPIFAVKGAHDFLCQQGLPPDLWLCVVENIGGLAHYPLTAGSDPLRSAIAAWCARRYGVT